MKIISGWHLPDFDTLLSKKANGREHPYIDYQQEILDLAMTWVRGHDLAIDVGANVGYHSVRFCQWFGQVHAFEPARTNYECLEHNIEMFTNITLHRGGLGSRDAEMNLEIPEDSTNCGAFSLKDFQDQTMSKRSETISIWPLDRFNLDPDLIKIDTQGFERDVLLGAVETIDRCRPVILAEVAKKGPVNELLSVLKPWDYQVVAATNKDKVFAVRR